MRLYLNSYLGVRSCFSTVSLVLEQCCRTRMCTATCTCARQTYHTSWGVVGLSAVRSLHSVPGQGLKHTGVGRCFTTPIACDMTNSVRAVLVEGVFVAMQGDKQLLLPHLDISSIAVLNWKAAVASGFRGVVFDKDNTLTLPYELQAQKSIVASLQQCVDAFKGNVVVFSNSAGAQLQGFELFAITQYGCTCHAEMQNMVLRASQHHARTCKRCCDAAPSAAVAQQTLHHRDTTGLMDNCGLCACRSEDVRPAGRGSSEAGSSVGRASAAAQ